MATTKGLSPLVQEQRVIKSEAEIKIMRQAGEISGKAFIEVNTIFQSLFFFFKLIFTDYSRSLAPFDQPCISFIFFFVHIDYEVHGPKEIGTPDLCKV